MTNEADVRRFVRAEIERLSLDGFKLLRSVPSTTAKKVVDYVLELTPTNRAELLDAFAESALIFLLPNQVMSASAALASHAGFRRFLEAMPMRFQWAYLGVRELRALAADRHSAKPLGISVGVPDEVMRYAESIEPTSAPQIRKHIRNAFADKFGAIAENRGGGEWIYSASHVGRAFKVSIDYGGRTDQLRYEVFYSDPNAGIEASRLTYEGMLGVGFGRWDLITAKNLADSIELLCQHISYVVAIPELLRSHFRT